MNDVKKIRSFIIGFTIGTIVLLFGGQTALMYVYSEYLNKNSDIGALSSFYSIIFTIVAIFIAIAAIIGWNWIKDEWAKTQQAVDEKIKELNENIKKLDEKTGKFVEVEKTIDYLMKKDKLAEWVQDKFEKDVEKENLTSISFELTEDERKKLKDIKEQILNETTDDSWLKIVYAKQLLDGIQKNGYSEEREFIKTEKIFNYIENRDLLKEDSEILRLLCHLKAQMYWLWYNNQKYDFIKKYDQDKENNPWKTWWENKEAQKRLEKSIEYYQKALDIQNQKKDNADETLGNLAVVLIELSKFDPKTKNFLDNAIKNLKQIKIETFNTHWDRSRALYYYMDPEKKDVYEKLLTKAAEEIDTKRDKKFFIDKMEEEIKETGLFYQKGFPGEESLIKKLKEDLHKRYLS